MRANRLLSILMTLQLRGRTTASALSTQLERLLRHPNSQTTALTPCPSFTRCTAALNSAGYACFGALNIVSFLPLGRLYTRPADEDSGEAHCQCVSASPAGLASGASASSASAAT